MRLYAVTSALANASNMISSEIPFSIANAERASSISGFFTRSLLCSHGPVCSRSRLHRRHAKVELRRRGHPLPVDELQHADDFARVGRHREDEHRLRQIAVFLVERGVDRVFGLGRQVVGVVDDERLAGHRHVAGQALLRDGQHALFEVDVDRIVLGELPAEDLPFAEVVEQVE